MGFSRHDHDGWKRRCNELVGQKCWDFVAHTENMFGSWDTSASSSKHQRLEIHYWKFKHPGYLVFSFITTEYQLDSRETYKWQSSLVFNVTFFRFTETVLEQQWRNPLWVNVHDNAGRWQQQAIACIIYYLLIEICRKRDKILSTLPVWNSGSTQGWTKKTLQQ